MKKADRFRLFHVQRHCDLAEPLPDIRKVAHIRSHSQLRTFVAAFAKQRAFAYIRSPVHIRSRERSQTYSQPYAEIRTFVETRRV